jgi:hypothetical protein
MNVNNLFFQTNKLSLVLRAALLITLTGQDTFTP